MKVEKNKTISICDSCGKEADYPTKCLGCGKEFCFDCYEKTGVNFRLSKSFYLEFQKEQASAEKNVKELYDKYVW